MLEGQADALYIHGGIMQVVVKRNYFESNSGAILDCVATNGLASVELGPN